MEAIPAMPVNPAPVTEAAAPRDAKGCAAAERGFGDALKQEIAARSSDSNEEPADSAPASEAVAEEHVEDTRASEPTPALDAAVAALLGEPIAQQQAAAIVAPAVHALAQASEPTEAAESALAAAAIDGHAAGAQRAAAERAIGDRAVQRGRERAIAVDRAPAERADPERTAAERGAFELGAIERSALDRNTFERNAFESGRTDLRELRAARESDDRGLFARDKSGLESAGLAVPHGFTVDRGATAADAPLPVSGAAATLDTLSAAALGGKWGTPLAGPADAAPAPVATARVETPLGAPGWGDAFQQKVVWVVDRQLERAELHVNPPHLGPVDVMLDLSGDAAQIAFASPHAAVREAIEASLPDLREALDQRGVSLGEATVGADSGAAREQFAEQAREAAARSAGGGSRNAAPAADSPTPARPAIVRRGLVDTFA